MLKKTLILSLLLAAGVSPFLPSAFADSASWKPLLADRVWDHETYRVQRLTLKQDVSGPYKKDGATFFAHTQSDQNDLSFVRDGKSKVVSGVDAQVLKPTWSISNNGSFVYFTKSKDVNQWLSAFVYDRTLKDTRELTTMDRKLNEMSFITLATTENRLYTSLIQSDLKTKKIESSLVGKAFDNPSTNRDISFLLTAPWQEVVDARDGWMLVKFQFAGGNKQLWLIHEGQEMKAIPNTWTEPQGDILYAQFLENGTVAFFQNYRLYTFDPKLDKEPQAHGDAKLSWVVSPTEAVQSVHNRMAWIDSTKTLFTVDERGVTKFGFAKNGVFTLGEQFLSFENDKGFRTYHFDTKQWSDHAFRVTDVIEDVIVGIDRNKNIWYENQTTGYILNIGYGFDPVLSDRTHAYWKGTDGSMFEARFSPMLDVQKPSAQAYKSFSNSTVYLVTDNRIWKVTDEKTYFTWFDSWKDVRQVTQAVIDVYQDYYQQAGDAPFAPGTRVKAVSNARVYVMGKDSELHWIVSETVADSIYGSTWNKGIIEVNDTFLWRFSTGKNIESSQSIKQI